MATWIFEPGHTEAEFRARHMMVTWVRGMFKDVHGRLEFDWDSCLAATFEGEMDATKIWTGEPERDAHLRSADFFDVENHPEDRLQRSLHRAHRRHSLQGRGRADDPGTTQTVPLDVAYLGQWETPFWVGDENKGTMRRVGFEAHTRLNRHDFGVSWQDTLPGGGVVASEEIEISLDIEAIHEGDLEKTGAIEMYR